MFPSRNSSHSLTDGPVSPLGSYGARIRAAHELADLLKRTRPHLYDQVSDLQVKITACQSTLDKSSLQQTPTSTDGLDTKQLPQDRATLLALEELETTTQALLDLRHKGQMAR